MAMLIIPRTHFFHEPAGRQLGYQWFDWAHHKYWQNYEWRFYYHFNIENLKPFHSYLRTQFV